MEKWSKAEKIEASDSIEKTGLETEDAGLLAEKALELENRLNSIDETKLSPEKKNRLAHIKEKIGNASKKLFNTVKWTALVVGTFSVAQYERTHSELEEIDGPNEQKEYRHPDARTTHLLNVLAGRESFTEKDLRVEYDNILKEVAEREGHTLDKNPEDMTIDELDENIVNLMSEIDPSVKRGDIKKDFEKEFAKYSNPDTNSQMKPVENMYELVWEMEKECGNPKVRFTTEDINFTPLDFYKGSLHYDAVSNTIYISYSAVSPNSRYGEMEDVIAELSHSKQLAERPVATVAGFVSDLAGVVSRSGFSAEKLADEYTRLYTTPGSVEYDAHQVIEPYLKTKYKFFVKK